MPKSVEHVKQTNKEHIFFGLLSIFTFQYVLLQLWCPYAKTFSVLFGLWQKKESETAGVTTSNGSATKPKVESTSDGSINSRPMSFSTFMSKKKEERASYFRPSKKPRVADKQEVTINIGLMELNDEEVGVPLRGKSLPLKIAKDADYKTLLEFAVKKRTDYDKTFDLN